MMKDFMVAVVISLKTRNTKPMIMIIIIIIKYCKLIIITKSNISNYYNQLVVKLMIKF